MEKMGMYLSKVTYQTIPEQTESYLLTPSLVLSSEVVTL